MTAIEDFNARANDDTDREHQMQIDLLQRLCQALDAGKPASAIHPLLDELIDFSEAHFMSEELLMRMKSYDDYAEHQEDHVHMLEVLRGLATKNDAGQPALMEGAAHDVLGFIRQHIATRDKRLADHVRHGL